MSDRRKQYGPVIHLMVPDRSHGRAKGLAFSGFLAQNTTTVTPNPKSSPRLVYKDLLGSTPRFSSVDMGRPKKFIILKSFLGQKR